MASTYSCSSFSGLVSSKRRWQRPPNFGEAEVQQDGFGVAKVQVTVRLGRKTGAGPGRAARRHGRRPCRDAGPAALRACLPAARSASTMFLMKLAAGAGVLAGWFGLLTG